MSLREFVEDNGNNSMSSSLREMEEIYSESKPLGEIETIIGKCYIVDKIYADKVIYAIDGNGIISFSKEERILYDDYVLYVADALHESVDQEPSKAIDAAVVAVRNGEDIDLCYSVTQAKLVEIGG